MTRFPNALVQAEAAAESFPSMVKALLDSVREAEPDAVVEEQFGDIIMVTIPSKR